MDAQQCVKLSLTNRSIGLISAHLAPRAAATPTAATRPMRSILSSVTCHEARMLRPAGLVAMAGGPTPDPIPNSAVKSPCADGTASQDVGE